MTKPTKHHHKKNQAGLDDAAIPPLLQFKLEEDNIKERSW